MSNVFVNVPTADVDFKSPIDEYLMTTMRDNDEYNKAKVDEALLTGGGNMEFKVNGNFNILDLANFPENGKDLDGGFVSAPKQLTRCSLFVFKKGVGGNFVFDLRRSVYFRLPIYQIINIFQANTGSVARGSSGLDTQTIVNAEATQDTQGVSFAFPTLSVDNIQQIQGTSLFRLNFDPAIVLDPEIYASGKYIVLDGSNNAGNDGVFQIQKRNDCGGVNLVIQNATGVTEIPSSTNVKANYAKYSFSTAAPSGFVVGESATFAGHVDASNNGTFKLFKKNEAGNNLVVERTTTPVVEQAIIQGSVDSLRWKYSFLNNVSAAFTIGENASFSGHTDAANDGSFEIKNKNVSTSFNIIIYNINGVAQAGIAGQVNTNRFVYALDADPTGFFIIGDKAVFAGHANAINNGTKELVDVKYLGNNNVVVYNASGIEELTAAGTVEHLQKAITFRTDQSQHFEAGKSLAKVIETASVNNEGEFKIVDINREVVSQFNLIVEMPAFVEQLGDAGCIERETRSIFTDGQQTVELLNDKQIFEFTNNVNPKILGENTIISLEVLQAPTDMDTMSINVN